MAAFRNQTTAGQRLAPEAAPARFAAAATLFLVIGAANDGGAADVVVIAAEPGGRLRKSGTILEFTGQELLLQTATDRTVSIAADRVIDIETSLVPDHLAADQLFAERRYRLAAQRYSQAQDVERRAWMRRRIVTRRVWCQRYLGNLDRAGEMFLVLVASDPSTQYLDAIPLTWSASQPDPLRERRSREWLQNSEQAVARLLGASWLLSGGNRGEAIAALRELRDHPDARIGLLAETQLWRTAVVSVTEDEIASWRQVVSRMPRSLRAGPYYLVGQALERIDRHRAAALTWMRVPILYSQQRQLAGESLLAAADALEKINVPQEAVNVYREILREHNGSSAAKIAEPRLRRLEGQQG